VNDWGCNTGIKIPLRFDLRIQIHIKPNLISYKYMQSIKYCPSETNLFSTKLMSVFINNQSFAVAKFLNLYESQVFESLY
jgi:hypothetical protein